MPTIDDVRKFWNANPLWTGDAQSRTAEPGTRAFFDGHTKSYFTEHGGKLDERLFPICDKAAPILDLGCGIGFWLERFGILGFTNITGADISSRSLQLAKLRCEAYGIAAQFREENAEATSFPDDAFEHIQSIGVIHHSPNPQASLAEIRRILKPGGRAVVSVYFNNFPLRHWQTFRPVAKLAARGGFTPKGRGRDDMMQRASDAKELVRLYDGRDNPIGMAFSEAEYRALLSEFRIVHMITHTFPARSLPVRPPRPLFRALEYLCPFMICVVVEKPSPIAS